MQLVQENPATMAEESNTAPRIKQERLDEREINQLAMEMAEKNKQKMISQAAQIAQQTQASQQALQRAGGQQMITFYFNREKNKELGSEDSIIPKKLDEKKKGTIDEESVRGRFGWSTIHNAHIPYVFRREDKYCAVRMVETKLLNKYLSYLPHEITTCIHVRSYFITEAEAKLLNEINMKHCEFQFGRDLFTTKDLVVRLQDARCFYKFLDTCFKKLVQKSPEQSEYCGFVRINGESVVPYTVKNSEKYVPLFYFEGETDTLKLKAEKVDNWELAYLKFCCKVQGIRNELFASDTCAVVSLEDVQQYFPKDTQFEDWWPQKTAEPMKVASHGTKPGGIWTQRPPGGSPSGVTQTSLASSSTTLTPIASKPPSVTATTASSHTSSASSVAVSVAGTSGSLASLTNSLNSINSLNSLYSQWATLVNGQAAAAAASAAAASAYSSSPNMQALLSGLTSEQMRRLQPQVSLPASTPLIPTITASQSTVRPPPLVRSSASISAVSTPTSSSAHLSSSSLDATLRQLGYSAAQINQSTLSSLVNVGTPTMHSYNTRQSSNSHHNSTANSSSKSLSKAPPPLIPVANGLRPDNLSSHKGVGRNGLDKQRLVDTPAFRPDPTRLEPPYKVRKMVMDGKGVLCINRTAYTHQSTSDFNMVAIQDVIKDFFPAATLTECIEVFQNVLTVTVYKANWHQVNTLMNAWGSAVAPDIVPLIFVSDLNTYLSQIKYIFQRHNSLSQSQAKRIRTT
ncbi:uncharacterized protein [Procambarus clarkii]|uniref:uncharacterized protein isoform X1 n=2 Tax=Procambarus clarkii TaxID=6728 RepID=UPI001E677DF5|nr:uncharacterized protein LOC123766899 isoform X1 [Procambarus clarkii]